MFNKEYYQNKKIELEKKFQAKKDEVLQAVTNLLNRYWEDVRALQERFKEVTVAEEFSKKMEEESKKATKEKGSKEEEKKEKK